MNGFDRINFAAQRQALDWKTAPRRPHKMTTVQNFVSNEAQLLLEVTYSGYTIKSARLWDFSGNQTLPMTKVTDGVVCQELTDRDRDKAARIENVLLGNGRRL